MNPRGKAWKFGDNIDTDVIIAAQYCDTTDPTELKKHCMEAVDENFPEKVGEGDFIVAGVNFGCGSSREHAPIAIKAMGIQGVIARSFARIFFRNSINIGLPVFESDKGPLEIDEGDEIEINPTAGLIRNVSKGESYETSKPPQFIREVIDAGGLIEYARKLFLKGSK